MAKNGSSNLWKWLLGGAAVAGGVAWAVSASAKPAAPPAPQKPIEPLWMNDNWVRNTLMLEGGLVPLPGYAEGSTQYKVRPTSYGTVNGVLMIALETPEMLEPAAQTLRKIMGPEGLAARKVLLKSGAKTLEVKW